MKKTLILLFTILVRNVNAQQFQKGNVVANLGLNFGRSNFAVPLSVEYSPINNIGAGVSLWAGGDGYNTYTFVGLRGSYYLKELFDSADFSVGASVGKFKYGSEKGPVKAIVHLMYKRYLNDQFGIYGGLNSTYDGRIKTWFGVGISMRFGKYE
ncbi:hypothetical protein GCM10011514_07400 [Emticicia aquatilis]|uniref:DUF3575 domain-containing protein n=1 Tax=Emticicia aquatilis TaxID=1537369 RepID=A0A917DJW8_9BACT|nr:hypothetical protein [Emticicia aquatilis]GGD45923.1 hypothetical protein GCM10011514_07400 [Emticicia aquatilis]